MNRTQLVVIAAAFVAAMTVMALEIYHPPI
jgi:hypothetical protein